MTDPVERERRKYRRQKIARQTVSINRIMFWLSIAFFFGMALLAVIFGKH